ncbi:hypothetical protein [Thermococcus siculi]|nr:hypothetical protein [Thermococcus siculi]
MAILYWALLRWMRGYAEKKEEELEKRLERLKRGAGFTDSHVT